jgi:hypothetical protein
MRGQSLRPDLTGGRAAQSEVSRTSSDHRGPIEVAGPAFLRLRRQEWHPTAVSTSTDNPHPSTTHNDGPGNMPGGATAGLVGVIWVGGDPGYLECFEEGEELVGWSVAARWRAGWCCQGEGALFDGEIAVEVDLGGLDVFVAEPEGDNGGLDTRGE